LSIIYIITFTFTFCKVLIIPYYITHYYIVLTFAQSIQIIACSDTR